ncbi:MAG: hypothetical protein NDJ94_08930 [Vicinamibacteria bacterium]|nr:hypothetical protein [Vicinamibacteria bacterium]
MSRPLAVLAALLLTSPASAANPQEDALKRAFEGKWVTVKIDLPATHKGLDLRFDREQPVDVAEHSDRLRDYDVAIEEGSRQRVTRIKLKGDMIEFHLAGGGFNWGSDTTTRTFSATSKSSRENELEKEIKVETDRDRKRRLERERDDLRYERERRDDRERREIEEWNRDARERDRDRSLRSGSRINLRFKKRVPADVVTAEGLERTLAPWVQVGYGPASGADAEVERELEEDERDAERDRDRADEQDAPADEPKGELRKGLLYDEVEALLGRPRTRARCTVGENLTCLFAVFAPPGIGGEVEALFIQDVLVRFGPPAKP